MKISVIIPVYNTPVGALETCLLSVLAIDRRLYEIIVVDDGSCEELHTAYCAYIEKLETNKVKIVRKENGGVSSARNAGIDLAKGEYVLFVDSDDVLLSDAFADICDDADLIVFDIIMRKGRKNEELPIKGINGKAGQITNNELLKNVIFDGKLGYVCGLMHRRRFLEEHNIRFNTNRIQQEDADFNFAVVNADPLTVYVDKAAYRYNYSAKTAIGRWAKAPDKMIAGGAERYEQRLAYIKEAFAEDSVSLQNRLTVKRIQALYQNGVDLCCAGQATTENKDKIQRLMEQITLPENADSKTRKCYQAIIHRKWARIFLIAKLRMVYLWAMGV